MMIALFGVQLWGRGRGGEGFQSIALHHLPFSCFVQIQKADKPILFSFVVVVVVVIFTQAVFLL